jgi:hypothetical protein
VVDVVFESGFESVSLLNALFKRRSASLPFNGERERKRKARCKRANAGRLSDGDKWGESAHRTAVEFMSSKIARRNRAAVVLD